MKRREVIDTQRLTFLQEDTYEGEMMAVGRLPMVEVHRRCGRLLKQLGGEDADVLRELVPFRMVGGGGVVPGVVKLPTIVEQKKLAPRVHTTGRLKVPVKTRTKTRLQLQSFDAMLKKKLDEFIIDICEEDDTMGLHSKLNSMAGSLPPHATYKLLHPLSVTDAVDVPKELVAWRTLKSMSAKDAANSLRQKTTREKTGVSIRKPPPKQSYPWWKSYKRKPRVKVETNTSRHSPPPHPPSEERTPSPVDSEFSTASSRSGGGRQEAMDKALLTRQLLWGSGTDSNETDKKFWKKTMTKVVDQQHAGGVGTEELCERKEMMWREVLQKRKT